jgi:hypothetical protein
VATAAESGVVSWLGMEQSKSHAQGEEGDATDVPEGLLVLLYYVR